MRWSEDDLSSFNRRRARRAAGAASAEAEPIPAPDVRPPIGPDGIVVVLRGEPRGKGRHRSRVVIPKVGAPFVHLYPDPVTVTYVKALAGAGRVAVCGRAPLAGPLDVTVTVVMGVPSSWSRKKRDAALAGAIYPTGKPDWDNFAKILDALNGVVWEDDKNIVRGTVVKTYGESPMLKVKVSEMPPPLMADSGISGDDSAAYKI